MNPASSEYVPSNKVLTLDKINLEEENKKYVPPEPDLVWIQLKLAGIEQTEPLSITLQKIPTSTLLTIFKKFYTGKLSDLARHLQVHPGNFTAFAAGKRGSQQSKMAIVYFLSGQRDPEFCSISDFVPGHQTNLVLGRILDYQSQDRNQSQGWRSLILIDFENYPSALTEWMSSRLSSKTVVVVYSGLSSRTILPGALLKLSNIFFRIPQSKVPQAADTCISMDIALFHAYLPPEMHFIVVTNDTFGVEVSHQLDLWGRSNARCTDRSKIDVMLNLFENFGYYPIPKDLTGEPLVSTIRTIYQQLCTPNDRKDGKYLTRTVLSTILLLCTRDQITFYLQYPKLEQYEFKALVGIFNVNSATARTLLSSISDISDLLLLLETESDSLFKDKLRQLFLRTLLKRI